MVKDLKWKRRGRQQPCRNTDHCHSVIRKDRQTEHQTCKQDSRYSSHARHTHTHTHTHTQTQTHTNTHTDTHTNTDTHTHKHRHTNTHTNRHRYTQTHTHARIQSTWHHLLVRSSMANSPILFSSLLHVSIMLGYRKSFYVYTYI
jgi:hypothetical protein